VVALKQMPINLLVGIVILTLLNAGFLWLAAWAGQSQPYRSVKVS
jgi:hypothetical protein